MDALGQDKCFRYDEAGRMTGVWEYVSPDEYRVTFYNMMTWTMSQKKNGDCTE